MNITLEKGAGRAQGLIDLQTTIDDLSPDKNWSVDITVADSLRRKIQNDLMWVWHGQWADFNGHRVGWAHGSTKLELLLPIKLACESKPTRKSAVFEQRVLSCVPDYNDQIFAAYRLVRSKGIPLRVFADFLSAYQVFAGEQGCILTSNKQELDKALMRDVLNDRRAA